MLLLLWLVRVWLHLEMVDTRVLPGGIVGRHHLEFDYSNAGATHKLVTRTDGQLWRRNHCFCGHLRRFHPVRLGVAFCSLIVLSPLIGFAVGLFVSIVSTWVVRNQKLKKVDRWFRRLQLVSASGVQPWPRYQRRPERYGHHYSNLGELPA